MKTIEIKLYKFDELSPESQKKAILNNYDINTDFEWWEPLFEGFKEELSEAGFFDAEIYFSGFWSQGDGACFDAKIDPYKFAETQNEKRIVKLIEAGIIEDFTINKTSFSNHYSHEKTRFVEIWEQGRPNIDAVLNSLCVKIEAKRLELCKNFYSSLEKDYYFLQSDEQVKESLILNEYDFTETGEIY